MPRLPHEPSAMANVFLSYAREDRARAKVIADVLSIRGWTVWWDRTIPPGRTFDDVIEDALDHARCVVVLWSKTSVASHWVKAEAAEGARRQILVPALLDDVKIPLEFRRVQAADLSAWNGDPSHAEFERFVQSISTLAPSAVPAKALSQAVPLSPQLAFDSFERATVPETRLEQRVERRRSHPIGLMVGAFVVIAAVAGGVAWRYLMPHDVTVPGVVGRSVTDARAAVTGAGLAVGRIDDRPTDETRPNLVLDQRPAAATFLRLGGTVDLVISSVPPVAVPSVIGVQLDEANAQLRTAGLTLGSMVFRDTNEVGASGLVVEQRPARGERVGKGASVDLVVARSRSTGPANAPGDLSDRVATKTHPSDAAAPRSRSTGATQQVEVPPLMGLVLAEARDRLIRRGLKVGHVGRRTTDTVAPDTVVAQEPAAGSKQAPGSSISLVIAEQAHVAVPTLVGLPLDKARVALAAAGLQLGNLAKKLDENVKEDSVIAQRPLPGARSEKGQRVDLDVGQPAVRVPRIVGLASQDALGVLRKSRLEPGKVTQRRTPGPRPGVIVSQSVPSGTPVAIGTSVDFEVASTPADSRATDSTGRRSTVNTVTNFRGIDRSPTELDVEVDLFYDGSLGTSWISLQACPSIADPKWHPGSIGCGKVPLLVGANHLTLTMRMASNARSLETKYVEVCIAQGEGRGRSIGSTCQVFTYTKQWGK